MSEVMCSFPERFPQYHILLLNVPLKSWGMLSHDRIQRKEMLDRLRFGIRSCLTLGFWKKNWGISTKAFESWHQLPGSLYQGIAP